MSTLPEAPERYGWWASLNHGGLLISPSRLAEHFPEEVPPLPRSLAERLRRDLVRLREGNDDHLGTFLDTVLEGVLGLAREQWTKGTAVDASWSVVAATRETLKPSRVWQGADGAVLPVFVADRSLGGTRDGGPARLGVGHGRRVMARVVEWLRRSGHRFALLANARQLRLVYAGWDHEAFCEWDTALWFQEGVPGPQVTALRALLSVKALSPEKRGEPAPLLRAILATRKGQAELSTVLGERVRQAVERLIQESSEVLDALDGVERRDIYIAATRLVMRCVVLLFAEARGLLPRHNAIYESSYGLQGLREQLERAAGGRAERLRHGHSAWPRLMSLFSLVYHGSQHEALPIPRYGGGLFTPGDAGSRDPILRALAAFESPENAPNDAAVHWMLERLCRSRVKVRQGRGSQWVEAPVDFSDLSSEYIGILYEGLLDFELRRAPADDAYVFLNLGDQPVLPLSRLDGMSNEALAKLLEKLQEGGKQEAGEGEEGEGTEEEEGEEGETDGASEEAPAPEEASELESDAEGALPRVTHEWVRTWAERAVKAAKLVKYPRNDMDARVREQFNREVAEKARALVARVVLPGTWFLVRWGGTRKGSGTFYTRPQLAGPMVSRALQPLVYADNVLKKPEEILALKVCDPAMGSGSFLVSALRFLTEALRESLFFHGRLEAQGEDTVCRLADGKPADHPSNDTLPVPLEHPEFEDRLRARLKRYVVERCLYGVDLDPLAVELGRTALWVETMDYRLPFGFLDHKLKCGNALVGCWFDRFQDYPVMAWEREGGDKGHDRFVHHFREVPARRAGGPSKRAGDKWTAAIKQRYADVIKPELKSWLLEQDPQQTRMEFLAGGKTADALHEEALRIFEEMHDLGVHEVEERASLYREKILKSEPLKKLKAAFDTWCALWFWPGDELELAPTLRSFLEPDEATRACVERIAKKQRFFHWELEFPDVFTGPEAGFHAIVGNPPWETQKPNSMEFFSNHDPLYRTHGKQEALQRQKELFEERAEVEREWLLYGARFKALSNWTRNAAHPFGGETLSLGRGREAEVLLERWRNLRVGRRAYVDPEHPFQHQGSADINSYKMFLEVAHALLARGGGFGLLVPSGLYSDKGSQELRALFLNRCEWTHLYAFQNERFVFEHIHHSFKMAVLHVRKGGRTEALLTRFRLGPGDSPEAHEAEEELLDSSRYLPLPAERIRRFSPNIEALLEIRAEQDLRILQGLYECGVLLGDSGVRGWGVFYSNEFHMANDSASFSLRSRMEANGYRADRYGHWLKGKWRDKGGSELSEEFVLSIDGQSSIALMEVEDCALPLVQGVMIGQLVPQRARWGVDGRAKWEREQVVDLSPMPKYLVRHAVVREVQPNAIGLRYLMRSIARTTDERTMIGSPGAGWPTGHSLAVLTSAAELRGNGVVWGLAAVLSSFVFDWMLRQRLAGTNISWSFLQEQSVPDSERVVGRCGEAVLRLAAAGLPYAQHWCSSVEIQGSKAKYAWRRLWAITPHERLRLRCILDAVVAELYGLDIDDFGWILRGCDHPVERVCDKPFSRTLDPKGFWRVDKEKHPELRHTVLSLVAFHELKRLGLDAFLALNDGDGWMLPETLLLADYGLGHDERARQHQPVAPAFGERFLPWQLEQGVEESWEECRRHAELISRIVPPPAPPPTPPHEPPGPRAPRAGETDLFGNPLEKDLFGNVVERRRGRGRRN